MLIITQHKNTSNSLLFLTVYMEYFETQIQAKAWVFSARQSVIYGVFLYPADLQTVYFFPFSFPVITDYEYLQGKCSHILGVP